MNANAKPDDVYEVKWMSGEAYNALELNIETKVIKLPVTESVGKGIWKTLNYEKKTVYIKDGDNDDKMLNEIERSEPLN